MLYNLSGYVLAKEGVRKPGNCFLQLKWAKVDLLIDKPTGRVISGYLPLRNEVQSQQLALTSIELTHFEVFELNAAFL